MQERRMNLTKLQETLLLLVAVKNQLLPALLTLVPKEHIEDDDLKFTVCNHLQILICSFLDEWKRLESYGSDSEIQKTLRIASPAVDRIRKWKGLPKLRSRLLAHGHRDKDGQPAWAWEVFERHKAPTAYAETILLGNCAVKAINIALERHTRAYTDAWVELMKLKREIEVEGIRTVGDIELELERVDNEIRKVAQQVT